MPRRKINVTIASKKSFLCRNKKNPTLPTSPWMKVRSCFINQRFLPIRILVPESTENLSVKKNIRKGSGSKRHSPFFSLHEHIEQCGFLLLK